MRCPAGTESSNDEMLFCPAAGETCAFHDELIYLYQEKAVESISRQRQTTCTIGETPKNQAVAATKMLQRHKESVSNPLNNNVAKSANHYIF